MMEFLITDWLIEELKDPSTHSLKKVDASLCILRLG